MGMHPFWERFSIPHDIHIGKFEMVYGIGFATLFHIIYIHYSSIYCRCIPHDEAWLTLIVPYLPVFTTINMHEALTKMINHLITLW